MSATAQVDRRKERKNKQKKPYRPVGVLGGVLVERHGQTERDTAHRVVQRLVFAPVRSNERRQRRVLDALVLERLHRQMAAKQVQMVTQTSDECVCM